MTKSNHYKYAHIYLAFGLVVVLIGFSKTYFNNLGNFSFSYHLHGISATLWMVLLIIQPYLFQKGKMKTHRLLGWSSLVLAPLIIIGGVIMMKIMIQGQANYPPNIVYTLAFIDVCTLFGFASLYILALYFRKNLMLHSRFMVSTIFGPLVPALTRLFLVVLGVASNFTDALTYSYATIELVLLIVIWKERNAKEIKFTYAPFLIFILIQHILINYVDDWNWWETLMNGFANYSQ